MAGKGGKRSTSWKKGQSGNPGGKPVNARNRVTNALLTALSDDFDEHGKDAIVRMREADPGAYIRVLASLVPKDVTVNRKTTIEDISDDELVAIARQHLASRSGNGAAEEEGSSGPADSVH